MESSGSSFIPQRPTKGKVAAKSFRKVYVLSYVSYLVFFTTLLAVGGVFLYQLTLKSELSALQQELVNQKNLFSQSDLDRVRNLDYRIDAAAQLVNNHASLLTVFNALDNIIADPVQFLSFNYDRKEDMRRPRLALSAVATEFDEVIFQEQVLRSNAITSRFNVANVNLSTQPIDPEQLELGVQQVVNVNLSADLSVSEINFTGFVANTGDTALLDSDEDLGVDQDDTENTETETADEEVEATDDAAVEEETTDTEATETPAPTETLPADSSSSGQF